MILVLTMIILNSIFLYLFNIKWYFSICIMLILMGQIMSLNYETKSIIDRGLLEHNPSRLGKILPRTLSKPHQAFLSKSTSIFFSTNIMGLLPNKIRKTKSSPQTMSLFKLQVPSPFPWISAGNPWAWILFPKKKVSKI